MVRNVKSVSYILIYKQVKNINLRVRADGCVIVSAAKWVPVQRIDEFVAAKEEWINRMQKRFQIQDAPIKPDDCLTLFLQVENDIFPLFEKRLKKRPLLKVKHLKSCWGICHPKKNYITLNTQLACKEKRFIEYVILHEYVHFIYPNHQKGFHQMMASLMPDYQIRRKALNT